MYLCAIAGGLWLLAVAPSHAENCDDLLQTQAQGTPRYLEADDLVRLRDIGPPNNNDLSARILAVSPDGDRVAFQIRRADPYNNSYCLGMFVTKIGAGQTPMRIDVGGDLIRRVQTFQGLEGYETGYIAPVSPKWSPDGSQVAYLRRDGGPVQLWSAKADGSEARALTDTPFDVEAFEWGRDGGQIVFSGRPALKTASQALEAEGVAGYLYDDRFVPSAGARPYVRGPIEAGNYVVTLSSKAQRLATKSETPMLQRAPPDLAATALHWAAGRKAQLAWTEVIEPENVRSKRRLQARFADGTRTTCQSSLCQAVVGLWWNAAQDELVFLTREGWRGSQSGLYVWRKGLPAPQRLSVFDDVLMGCQIGTGSLICGVEGSSRPRRIERLDLKDGKMSTLFDPNPDFAFLTLGKVERLKWTNTYGLPTFGDFVLPPDHKPGQKHPLIVVQYESRGFLRGGTGDEYPIFLFASHGFAVLSFQRPDSYGHFIGKTTWPEINRTDREGWVDRRSVQDSLAMGVRLAINGGAVDPERVGITGLSDGASTTGFALINSRLFKAAAMSSCCEEPVAVTALVSDKTRVWLREMGYPALSSKDDTFWKPVSLVANAREMNTPLLLQLPDDEFLGALEANTVFRELNKPVEMYLFPNEHHFKWQPAHRKAIYLRSLAWFEFWLMAKENADPAMTDSYFRWRKLR